MGNINREAWAYSGYWSIGQAQTFNPPAFVSQVMVGSEAGTPAEILLNIIDRTGCQLLAASLSRDLLQGPPGWHPLPSTLLSPAQRVGCSSLYNPFWLPALLVPLDLLVAAFGSSALFPFNPPPRHPHAPMAQP